MIQVIVCIVCKYKQISKPKKSTFITRWQLNEFQVVITCIYVDMRVHTILKGNILGLRDSTQPQDILNSVQYVLRCTYLAIVIYHEFGLNVMRN